MSSAKKGRPALGRGLSSLITTVPTGGQRRDTTVGRRILTVPIEQVARREDQPRSRFDEAALEELAASIREKGVLLPILVRRLPSGYQIIAGERRWRAAQRAGLKEVPVLVEEADEDEAFELALIENIQREDLNPIEEAEAYRRLLDRRGWTQEELAQALGKDRSTVANALRLLKLPERVRQAVVDGHLSMGHARALLSLGDGAEMERVAEEIVRKRLSVRRTEHFVRTLKQTPRGGRGGAGRRSEPSPAVKALVRRLERALGTRVRIEDQGGRGRLVVEYGSLDELDRILGVVLPE